MMCLLRDMRLELTEARAEVEEILFGEILAANNNHDVIEKSAIDQAECRIVEISHVDAGNFSADFGCRRTDVNHGISL